MKTFARKIYMFNNFLRLAEIKAVLEGRGFRPNFWVTGRGALKVGGLVLAEGIGLTGMGDRG